MKVYVVADIEGVSGVSGFDTHGERFPGEVEKKREMVALWAGEINAAISGVLAGGAEEVVVLDNHGPGESLPLALLQPPARIIHGRGRPTWLPQLDRGVEALLFVGQHARVGTPQGHLCHTYSRTRLRRIRLNGQEIGEIGLVAGIAGTCGVPAVFLSGDRRAVEEFGELVPGAAGVAVKEGLSLRSCASLPCQEAREAIRAGVEQGLDQRGRVAPVIFPPPLELIAEYRFRDCWRVWARSLLRPRPGMRPSGMNCLKLTGDNLPELWDRFIGMVP